MQIAVDFDGTIVDHRYPKIGQPVPDAFKWLKEFAAAGAKLFLWTMRSDGPDGPMLTEAVEFCRKNGVEFSGVNANPQEWTTSPKCYAHIYIDDAAFGCPLMDNPRCGGRQMVDWSEVGPAVFSIIRASE